MAQALVNKAKNRRQNGKQKSPRTGAAARLDVQLIMECIDEELSDAQKRDFRQKQDAYRVVKAQIDRHRADKNCIVRFFDTPLTPDEIDSYSKKIPESLLPRTISPLPTLSTRGRPKRKSAIAAQQQVMCTYSNIVSAV